LTIGNIDCGEITNSRQNYILPHHAIQKIFAAQTLPKGLWLIVSSHDKARQESHASQLEIVARTADNDQESAK
jgi:hypothetical protein